MRAWRELEGFNSDSGINELLLAFGTTESSFSKALGIGPGRAVDDVDLPAWVSEIIDVYSDEQAPGDQGSVDLHDFFPFIAPLSTKYCADLLRDIDLLNEGARGCITAGAVTSLRDSLDEQLLSVVVRPLILELNAARMEGSLGGASSEERYAEFVTRLASPTFRLGLWRQYPGMARQAIKRCHQWFAASREFLSRFSDDSELLSQMLSTRECVLEAASYLGSESHQGGRRVILATFAGNVRLLYKPRPLAITKHFQELLAWLNDAGQDPPLRTVMIIDRGTYGWMEHVSAEICGGSAALRRFYQRQGALIAIMYVVGASDCHLENVIACGENPVIVDLETLFQPRLLPVATSTSPDDRARAALLDSVLFSGFLPAPVIVNGRIVDLSGLGGGSFQDTHLDQLQVVEYGTDTTRVQRVKYRVGVVENRPVSDGAEANSHDHVHDIIFGFDTTYALFLERRTEMCAAGGPIERLWDDFIRVLIRPTAAYTVALSDALHPNSAFDSNESDRVLMQLWGTGARAVFATDSYWSEYEQLRRGDVPYFFSTPRGHVVYGDTGKAAFTISLPGATLSARRFVRLGPVDQRLQRAFIRTAVDALKPAGYPGPTFQIRATTKHGNALAIARRIGDYFERTAFVDGTSATWLSRRALNYDQEVALPVELAGTDLYDGLAGIALFLAYLGQCTNEKRFDDLSRGALQTIDQRLLIDNATLGIGAFDGLAGLLYVYSHLGAIWGDRSLLNRADQFLTTLGERITHGSAGCDLMSGAAGAILALVAYHSVSRRPDALICADKCAERLDAALHAREDGLRILPYNRGASHGYSGIALALAALVSVTGSKHLSAATAAMQFDAKLTEAGRWTDPGDPHRSTQATWCHGAPGIAMCRSAAFAYLHDERQLAAIRAAALETEISPGIASASLGLCHGELGIIDALISVSGVLGDSEHWWSVASARLDAYLSGSGWPAPSPEQELMYPLGMMTGLAGTAFGLLRFAEPCAVPSVLVLEPPKRRSS